MANYQVYVTFSGEASKLSGDATATGGTADAAPTAATTPILHVRAYDASGKDLGAVTPDYSELRGMALMGQSLVVAIANKNQSAIAQFSAPNSGGQRTFVTNLVTPQSSSALSHPYAVAFNGTTLFVSSQDTNVVSSYPTSANAPWPPAPVASYLTSLGTKATGFYPGTFVASACSVLVGQEYPPAVTPEAGGLSMIGFGLPPPAPAKTPTRHSVRAILFVAGMLYVADEAGARVGIYDAATGAFHGALTTTTDGKDALAGPVGLAYDAANGHMYIGDPGSDAIFTYHIASTKLVKIVDKHAGDMLKKVSGLCCTPDGTVLFGSRETMGIYALDTTSEKVTTLVDGLSDTPECLLVVPSA